MRFIFNRHVSRAKQSVRRNAKMFAVPIVVILPIIEAILEAIIKKCMDRKNPKALIDRAKTIANDNIADLPAARESFIGLLSQVEETAAAQGRPLERKDAIALSIVLAHHCAYTVTPADLEAVADELDFTVV